MSKKPKPNHGPKTYILVKSSRLTHKYGQEGGVEDESFLLRVENNILPSSKISRIIEKLTEEEDITSVRRNFTSANTVEELAEKIGEDYFLNYISDKIATIPTPFIFYHHQYGRVSDEQMAVFFRGFTHESKRF